MIKSATEADEAAVAIELVSRHGEDAAVVGDGDDDGDGDGDGNHLLPASSGKAAAGRGKAGRGSGAAASTEKLGFRPQLVILYMIVVCDAMALTIIFPFVPGMTRDRFHVSEQQADAVVGALIGSYNLARFVSSFYLGHLSDVYGRRVLLMVGLVASLASMLSFALARSWLLALAARIAGGLLNSNSGIASSCISDITQGAARAQAMAYLGASFALARSMASALSGLLTGVDVAFEPFASNPYLLPISVGSLFLLSVIVLAATRFDPDREAHSAGPSVRVVRAKPSLRAGLRVAMASDALRRLFVMGGITAWCNGSTLLCLVLLCSAKPNEYGLGFSSFGTGLILAFFGATAFTFQVTCSHRVMRRWPLRIVFAVGNTAQALGVAVMPLAGALASLQTPMGQVAVMLVLAASVATIACGFMMALPTLFTMNSNAAVPEQIGLIQGTSQSIQSLTRALGPALSGIIFGLTRQHNMLFVSFLLLAGMYLYSAAVARGLGTEVEVRKVVDTELRDAFVLDVDGDDDGEDEDGEEVVAFRRRRSFGA